MHNDRTGITTLVLAVVFALFAATASAQLTTISSFPYNPSEAEQASHFVPNFGSGPATGGSNWANGSINGNRRGTGGAGVQAWANQPTANYTANTTRWLSSPIFNLSGQSGLVLEYELWIRAQANQDGMKLQVSTNGGTVWTDVTTSSVAYNGNTNTSNLLASKFGGGNAAWTGTGLGGATANTCWLNLNPWAGQSDVRFRWCFVSNGSTHNNGPVLDTFRVKYVTSTTAYASGFVAVPQGQTVTATITKTQGQAFTGGMTVFVNGTGVTGTVVSVINSNQCTVDFTATRIADIAGHTYFIRSGSTDICQGIVDVYAPQQRVAVREGGSVQEPPQNASMGANGVYLHNGEFRHDLPIVSIPGRMLPLGFGLTYRSRLEYLGPVGAGWTASFDRRLYYFSGSDTVELRSGDGRIDTFTLAGGGTAGVGPYVRTGFFCEITRNNSGTPAVPDDDVFTITYAHGSTAKFEATNQDTANLWIYRETEFADRYGNKVVNLYNGFGQLEEMRGDLYDAGDPGRYRLVFEYRADGRLEFVRDYADYTAESGVIGGTYVGVREFQFVYNSSAQLTEIKLPKTEQFYSETKGANYRARMQFTYDGSDNLLEVIDARQANETSPLGWLLNHYDGSQRIDYQDVGRNGAGDVTHRQNLVYSTDPGLGTFVAVINALKYRSDYFISANGTTNRVRHHTGEWNTSLTQTAAKIRAADPNYFENLYEYDSEFHCTRVVMPRGNESRFFYDIANASRRSRGNLLRVFSGPGTAGTANLPADQVNGLLATFTYTNSANFNLLATSTGPRAYVLGSGYDITTNSPVTPNNPTAFTTTNTYNANGTLQKTSTAAVNATLSPESLNVGQILETTFTYNALGQLETSTDQAGVIARNIYGTSGFSKGLLTEQRQGDQTGMPLTTLFTHNSLGRVRQVQDPRGFVHTSYVNQLDQTVRIEEPPVAEAGNAVYFTAFTFDLNGNVATKKVSNIDEFGTTQSPSTIDTTYTYDISDNVLSVTEPVVAGVTRTITMQYDQLFRSVSATLPEGNQTATDYDELNRAIKSYSGFNTVNIPKASALVQREAHYDLNGNVVRRVDGRGNDDHTHFDAYDRAYRTEDRLAASPNYTLATYNSAGRIVSTQRYGLKKEWQASPPPGQFVIQSNALITETSTLYDNLDRAYGTKVLAHKNVGGSLGYLSGVGGDGWTTTLTKFRANGQVEETRDDLSIPTKYVYDAYNRVQRAIDDRDGAGSNDNEEEYVYDANGNVTAITARLFDDAETSPGPHKVLTTQFIYDSHNRVIEDRSPPVDVGVLVRTMRYDSRDNLVRVVDRKGVTRTHEYDLLGRMVRSKTHGVTRREIGPGGLVNFVTYDVASRTVYDKNGNRTEAIDPNGNRTYFRFDLANRWLQTQHADGGAGTPLKTTAGATHSISLVGSGPFYGQSGAYDGNSNLLKVLDANNTLVEWIYDENDRITSENGAPSAGNPFGVIGETGMDWQHDGLYRAHLGKTRDSVGDLTDTDSAHNSLGGLEVQRQRVHRAHPNHPTFTTAQLVQSSWDELGRRYRRINPDGATRTDWEYDRKHRPSVSKLYYNGVLVDNIAEFSYIGGGELHSKHIKRHPGAPSREIVSTFKRDNLLRITSVRHVRDDSIVPGLTERLFARYDYGFDAHDKTTYEARWYEDDGNATSNSPSEVDFFRYANDDLLEKSVFCATKDIFGFAIDMSLPPNWMPIGDFNHGTFSDRMLSSSRKAGSWQSVNWSRGAPSATSPIEGPDPDDTVAPDQTTSYQTSDDPAATPDMPAADGNGSRHNHTQIGQVAYTYDNKRNVLADETREFRYNYKDQLRKVWRKSDGAGHGLVAVYREDAFGNQVYREVYWDLMRRARLDTRFELDVKMDADGNGADMQYVDGGIMAAFDPPPGQADEHSSWPSLIDRPTTGNETHYFDYLIDVPAGTSGEYLGYVGYKAVGSDIRVRIFTDLLELWDEGNATSLATYTPAGNTAGRHNIGICAGVDGPGVYYDGNWIMGGPAIRPKPQGSFGTHASSSGGSIVLFEFLSYIKAFFRPLETTDDGAAAPAGEGVVSTRAFDEPIELTHTLIIPDPTPGNDPQMVLWYQSEDSDGRIKINGINGTNDTEIILPNGKGRPAVVTGGAADVKVRTGDGELVDGGDVLPGVKGFIGEGPFGDGTRIYVTPDPFGPKRPDSYRDGTGGAEGPRTEFDKGGRETGSGLASGSGDRAPMAEGTDVPPYDYWEEEGEWYTDENTGRTIVIIGNKYYEWIGAQSVPTDARDAKGNPVKGYVAGTGKLIPLETDEGGFEWFFEYLGAAIWGFGKYVIGAISGIGDLIAAFMKDPPAFAKKIVQGMLDQLRDFIEALRDGNALAALRAAGLGELADFIDTHFIRTGVDANEMGEAAGRLLGWLITEFGKNIVGAGASVALGGLMGKVAKALSDAKASGKLVDSPSVKKLERACNGDTTGKSGTTGCFVAGTLVHTESGLKPIEDIRPGERVWAWNEAEGVWLLAAVSEAYVRNYEGDIVTLTVVGEVIQATGNHPFWVLEGFGLDSRPEAEELQLQGSTGQTQTLPGRWVEARDIRVGDKLWQIDGTPETVTAVVSHRRTVPVYNFTVPGNHTYTVGSSGTLVHNSDGVCPVKRESGPYKEVKGHHVHAKAGFKGHANYDPKQGFSISQEYMKSRGWDHDVMTAKQRELFSRLEKSGDPNTLKEHSRIAVEALEAAGATRAEARRLVAESLRNLKEQGVREPTHIPWS